MIDLSIDQVLRLRAWKPSWEPGTADLDRQIEAYARSKRRPRPKGLRKALPYMDPHFNFSAFPDGDGGGGGDDDDHPEDGTPEGNDGKGHRDVSSSPLPSSSSSSSSSAAAAAAAAAAVPWRGLRQDLARVEWVGAEEFQKAMEIAQGRHAKGYNPFKDADRVSHAEYLSREELRALYVRGLVFVRRPLTLSSAFTPRF